MRKTAILGLAAATLLAAASAPVRALPAGWYALGSYQCRTNHSAVPGASHIRYTKADSVRECQELCDTTKGCVAFSYERRWLRELEFSKACILFGRYDFPTAPFVGAGFAPMAAVCYRHHAVWDELPSEWRNRLGLEQDQLRPGLRPSVPSNPNRP